MNKATEILKQELTENMVNTLVETPHFEEFIIDAMISYSDVKCKDAYDEIERLKIGIMSIAKLTTENKAIHDIINDLLNPVVPILTSEE